MKNKINSKSTEELITKSTQHERESSMDESKKSTIKCLKGKEKTETYDYNMSDKEVENRMLKDSEDSEKTKIDNRK